MRKSILVTGAMGQIGSELTVALRHRYGGECVLATDVRGDPPPTLRDAGPFDCLDCLDQGRVGEVVRKHRVDTIFHLPALLSATAEKQPQRAWSVNMNTLLHVLEVAREQGSALFVPSSIAAFGPTTPLDDTPQDTIQRPTTMYGVTKVAGELLCDYYHARFGVDVRGVRYPGIISSLTLPGGGTTDYAVDIFYQAIQKKRYTCYLKPGTFLDMMYMPDAIQAAMDIMEADGAKLRHRNAFNVSSMSFAPEQLAAAIQKHIPEFVMDHQVDPGRQAIAESWPNRMDDSAARREWGWSPVYDMDRMVEEMLRTLGERFARGGFQ